MPEYGRQQLEHLVTIHQAICAIAGTDPVDMAEVGKTQYPVCTPPLPLEEDGIFGDEEALVRQSDGVFCFPEDGAELFPEEIVERLADWLVEFDKGLSEWIPALVKSRFADEREEVSNE